MLTCQDWNDAAKRLLNIIETGTPELDEGTYEVPVSHYIDERRWKQEIEVIFKRQPLILALGCELAEPNSYKAMYRAGVPLLLARGDDGRVRGFINKCRHRGAPVTGDVEKCGVAKRFSCPYHAWTFDNKGALIGLPGREQFGEIPEDYRHLIEISVDERAGFIWGILTPGIVINLEAHLGAMLPLLEKVGIDRFHFAGSAALKGANWKFVHDGNIEHYHFNVLHKDSFGGFLLSDATAYDEVGPHTRFFVPGTQIRTLRDIPEANWKASQHLMYSFSIFPNCGMALTPHEDPEQQMLSVNLVWPGDTPATSIAHMLFATPRLLSSDEDRQKVEQAIAANTGIILKEDYWVVEGQQVGLESMADDSFIYGRMERMVQTFERRVNTLVDQSRRDSALVAK